MQLSLNGGTMHEAQELSVATLCLASSNKPPLIHASDMKLRQSMLAAAAAYMRRNKLKIGDVIAITRRPDTQLVSSVVTS